MGRLRTVVQAVWTAATNSYLVGFAQGRIYQGPLKQMCVPGLNCYACPGAVGSCPIGALQAVLGSPKLVAPYYVLGFLTLVGALSGRFTCGFLCPFGWFQDLLYKIPLPKKVRTFRLDRPLRWMKYLVLLLFVFVLTLFSMSPPLPGTPYFCKLLCPAGMLEGGIPLVIGDENLRAAVGFLYAWKGFLLAATVGLSMLIYRPFCKYVCPLGAIYSVFNRASLHRLTLDAKACIACGKCARVCKMGVDPSVKPSDGECIRCGDCVRACPTRALHMGLPARRACPANDRGGCTHVPPDADH